ncbi:type III secretion protein, partial [Pectobacterium odoriferum]
MNLNTWRAQHRGSLFAIVDGAADPSAVARFYELSEGEASPLFAGTPFSDQAALGPWLLLNPSLEFVA